MDFRTVAKEVIEGIGGNENIVSVAHCATRLRLVISDNKKCNKQKIEEIEGVKGAFEASGQLQIIFGTGMVNKVYDEFIKLTGAADVTKEEVKQVVASKQNPFMRSIKMLGDIFVPIIPAIVASGLLMGLLEGIANVFPNMTSSGTYTIIHLFSNAAFVFLPILIAISAGKVFGGNIYLSAVIGMIMIHPDLMNAWAVAGAEVVPQASVWFGVYDISLVGYQGHVIPIVIAIWFMSSLEKKLHQVVPEIIDLFVTPLVTVLVTGYLALTIIGPIFVTIENGILSGAQWLITLPFGIGSAIAAGVYGPTVVGGVHHMYNALEAGLLSSTGLNTWMPIATAANVAQGAAALALALKTKNAKTKALALPAALSAFLGITEPAIFGVNLRYFKAFIAACIGGACGGLVAGVMNIGATAYGITGVFGVLITTNHLVPYLLMMIVSSAVAFALSWIMFKEETQESVSEPRSQEIAYSPIEGKVISMTQVKDATFSTEILGKGAAIIPAVGKVFSPIDGKVETLFPTKHAIGITGENGVEILIHVGINTVELDGQYFNAVVKQGDTIRKGELLLEFDIEGIQKAGYDVTTPVIVSNTGEYQEIVMSVEKNIGVGDILLNIY